MLVGRPGLSPVMIGRAIELDRLVQLSAEASRPAVALIGGEAGVGKTRLVRELLDRLPATSAVTLVLAGQADPASLGQPLAVVVDALRGAVGDDEIAALDDAARPLDERIAAAEALVRTLAAERPTVVVFDDLHWADAPSVGVFERLAEPDSGPVLLVATYRPDGMNRRQPAAQLLPRLERRRAVTHLRLERLTVAEVGSFVAAVYGRTPSYRVVETLHARTGGNPYFLEELLGAARGADPDELCDQPLPWSLGELVRGQLDGLEPHERRILEAAAVLGGRVSFDVLASVTSTSEDDLIRILRSLVVGGMLVESETDVFTFRHALAREAIEADLLGREKRRLHEWALRALRAAGSTDLSSIAHHAHGAGRYDEMIEAVRAGAREHLERGSTYQALQLAELGLSEAVDDIELLGLAARAAWLAGLSEDAVGHAEHLLAVARRHGRRDIESSALRRLVRLRWELGDRDALERSTEDLIALSLELEPGEELGNAMACIAQSFMLRERSTEAIEWADRAIALADELDLPAVRVWAQCERGSAMLMMPDRMREGGALLDAVADEAEALGEYVIMARALNNRVRTGPLRRDSEEARKMLERMQRAAELAGFDSLAGPGYSEGLASIAEWEGDLGAATELLDEGRRHRIGRPAGKGCGFETHAAGLALEAGDVDQAESLFRDIVVGVGALSTSWFGLAVHIACRRGDLDEARQHLPHLVESVATMGADGGMLHDVVSALLRAGATVDEVRPLVEQPIIVDGQPAALDTPWRSLLAAQILEADGQHDLALHAYEDALVDGAGVLGQAQVGTAHVGAARVLIHLGRLDEARAHVTAAAAALERWQGWRVEELRAVQRRLGVGPDVAGPQSLTPREREVVALLAEGLTNAELATRLYISPKTAAVHVSNILAKLGMSSRTEVAAFAAREGLATA